MFVRWAGWRTRSRSPRSCWLGWSGSGWTRGSRSASAGLMSTSSTTQQNSKSATNNGDTLRTYRTFQTVTSHFTAVHIFKIIIFQSRKIFHNLEENSESKIKSSLTTLEHFRFGRNLTYVQVPVVLDLLSILHPPHSFKLFPVLLKLFSSFQVCIGWCPWTSS